MVFFFKEKDAESVRFCGSTTIDYPCLDGKVPVVRMETTDSQSGVVGTPLPGVPVGLEAVYASCRALYPNQPNPLQVTAVVKFW